MSDAPTKLYPMSVVFKDTTFVAAYELTQRFTPDDRKTFSFGVSDAVGMVKLRKWNLGITGLRNVPDNSTDTGETIDCKSELEGV